MSEIPVSERVSGAAIRGRFSRWNFPSRHFRWVTAGGFLLATGILVFLIGMAYRETGQQIHSSESVIHSRDVIAAIAEYATAAKAAGAAATDDYKSGNEADVPTFVASKTSIHAAIDHVRQLAVDNPAQQRLVADLNSQTIRALVLL